MSSLGLACVPHTMVTKTSNIPIGLDHKKGPEDDRHQETAADAALLLLR